MRPGCSVHIVGSTECDPAHHVNKANNLMDDGQGVWTVPHKCVGNFITAIRNRGVVDTPSVPPLRNNNPLRQMHAYGKWMSKFIGRVKRMTVDELISAFPKAKLGLYKKLDEIIEFIEKDAHVRLFVKDEKHPLKGMDEVPDPRMIYAKSKVYNCVGFSLLREIEHKMMNMSGDGVHLPDGRIFAKGLNAFERYELLEQKWNSIEDVVAVKLDWSRFDSTVNTELLKVEHDVYKRCHSGSALMQAWSKCQFVTHGSGYIGETKIKVKMTGGRCSGDVNTGFGNSFLTSGMISTFCRSENITYNLVVDGDDAIAFVTKAHLERFRTKFPVYCKELGTNVKVEGIFTDFKEIIFCQAMPFRSRRKMILDPTRVVNRFAGNSKGFRRPTPDYMVTVGQCEASVNAYVPYVQRWAYKMYETGLALGGRFQATILDDYKRENHFQMVRDGLFAYTTPTKDDRHSLHELTGILPREQEILERMADAYDFHKAYDLLKRNNHEKTGVPFLAYNELNSGGLHAIPSSDMSAHSAGILWFTRFIPPGPSMARITGATPYPIA